MSTEIAAHQPVSLVAKFAGKFGVEPNRMIATLKATAFRQSGKDEEVTNEQMMALLVVADQYNLNPWTREIFAFNDRAKGIVPIVSVDGWTRIINEHSSLDGIEFSYGPASSKHKGAPEWIECSIYRKDRSRPIVIREVLAECYRDTGPWNSHPSRMLRWKSLIQCARVAFGFAGIYDQDEAERIIEHDVTPVATPSEPPKKGVAGLRDALKKGEPAKEAAPAPEPQITLDAALGELAKIKNADEADLLLDRVRGSMSEEDLAELRAAYDTKFATKE